MVIMRSAKFETSKPKLNIVQDLVGRLTLDEMVAQMSHGGGTSVNGDLKQECGA